MKNYFFRSIPDSTDLFDFFYSSKEEAQEKGKPCIVMRNGVPVYVITHFKLTGDNETYEAMYFTESYRAING